VGTIFEERILLFLFLSQNKSYFLFDVTNPGPPTKKGERERIGFSIPKIERVNEHELLSSS
jgi:hypothetical protein